jgi:hypothetical protein
MTDLLWENTGLDTLDGSHCWTNGRLHQKRAADGPTSSLAAQRVSFGIYTIFSNFGIEASLLL